MCDELFGSMHIGESDLHTIVVDGCAELGIRDKVTSVLNARAVPPQIAIQEDVARDRAPFNTGKNIASEPTIWLKRPCTRQGWTDARRTEVLFLFAQTRRLTHRCERYQARRRYGGQCPT